MIVVLVSYIVTCNCIAASDSVKEYQLYYTNAQIEAGEVAGLRLLAATNSTGFPV
jgi:hypothetical protein